jgi:AAA domain/CHC2 zinc finger
MKSEATVKDVLSEIKQDIRLYEHRVMDLKRQGDGWIGHCPLHNDRHPSLHIDRRGGVLVFYCHPCETGGTVIDLEMRLSGSDEKAAIAKLKAEHNSSKFTPPPPMPDKPVEKFNVPPERIQTYVKNLEEQNDWGGEASDYLAKSGLTAIAERLKLGYEPKKYFGCEAHCGDCREYPALVIPIFWQGELTGLKFKNLRPPEGEDGKDSHKWTQVPGSKADLLWLADLEPANAESNVVGAFEGVRDIALARALGFNAIGFLATSSVPEKNPSERFQQSINRTKQIYQHAVLIGDNDEPGEEAKRRLKKLFGRGASFAKIPEPYQDLSRFYEKAGADAVKKWLTKLYAVATETQSFGVTAKADPLWVPDFYLNTQRADTVKMKRVDWLWDNKIPKRNLIIFSGSPDVGKSTVTCDVIMRLTRCKDWPNAKNKNKPTNVIVLCAEDDQEDTIVPRLNAAGADLTKVHFAGMTVVEKNSSTKQREFALDTDLTALENTIQMVGDVGLVVVDPLNSYLSETDINKAKEVRRALHPVGDLAKKTGTTFLIIVHFNKRMDVGAMGKVSGSTDLVAITRSTYMFGRDPKDPEQYLMGVTKNNLSKVKTSLVYKLEEHLIMLPDDPEPYGLPKVVWTGEDNRTADEIIAESQNTFELKSDAAASFLQEQLSDGPKLARDLYAKAEKQGFKDTTLKNAKAKLKVRTRKQGSAWIWSLPTTGKKEEPPAVTVLDFKSQKA